MTKNKDTLRKIFAGSFLLGGILLTIVVIFTLGKDKGLTQSKFKITVLYRDVGGLMEGAPVRLAGVNIGNVSRIGFLDEEVKGRRVRVILNIFDTYKDQLDVNAAFFIKTEGVLGEKLIEIDVMDFGKKLDLNQAIMGEDTMDVQDLAKVFARTAESFTETSEELSKIDMKKLIDILGETAQSMSMTSKGMNVVLEELQYIAKKTMRLLDRIEQRVIDGNLFKVF
jgi:ABC-type transporter Mla subunit MlaD